MRESFPFGAPVKVEEEHLLFDEERVPATPLGGWEATLFEAFDFEGGESKRYGLHTNLLVPGSLPVYSRKEVRGASVEFEPRSAAVPVELELAVAATICARVQIPPFAIVPLGIDHGLGESVLAGEDPLVAALARVAREGPFFLQGLECFRVRVRGAELPSAATVRANLHGPYLRADLDSKEWRARRVRDAANGLVCSSLPLRKSPEHVLFDTQLADEEGRARLFVGRPLDAAFGVSTNRYGHHWAVPAGYLLIVEALVFQGEGRVRAQPRLLGDPFGKEIVLRGGETHPVEPFPLLGCDPFDLVVDGAKPGARVRMDLVGSIFTSICG